MRITVLKETRPYERRVAMVPDVVAKLIQAGYEIGIETKAGEEAGFSDESYKDKGASIISSTEEAVEQADIVLKVQPPFVDEIKQFKNGSTFISFLAPGTYLNEIKAFSEKSITAFSLELLPRISRAQSMDALSSQATVSGYIATLTTALSLPKFFPMFMTAAGTVPPAKVFVMGAGVAGLQAIATARRLGANVRAYDVRPAAMEEVKSLGATFVTLDLESQAGEGGYAKEQSEEFLKKQQELMTDQLKASDVVITTAAIPGRPAPRLITKQMVEAMSNDSVIFDLAAESGGNCELSQPGETVIHKGVKIIGARNVPSQLPTHASFLLSRNLMELTLLMTKEGNFVPDFEDEIVSSTCVVKNGEIVNESAKKLLEGSN